NLTPMIDIVFLLIIFFMVGTKFSELSEAERNIDLNVPEVQTAKALTAAPKKRVINVFEDGQVTLDDIPVSLQELTSELADAKQQYDGLGVIVRGDAAAFYQHVADVLAACNSAEISDLGISVRVARKE
ncbi:MAG: ExbD/TolR family protein, partial [Pirellulaceae bacterium]